MLADPPLLDEPAEKLQPPHFAAGEIKLSSVPALSDGGQLGDLLRGEAELAQVGTRQYGGVQRSLRFRYRPVLFHNGCSVYPAHTRCRFGR